MKKLYSGIGPRKTPPNALSMMTEIASQLASNQWLLRSGHGAGADQAFENGAPSNLKEVFIPNDGFNGAGPYSHYKVVGDTPEIIKIARDHHPGYDRCSPFTRKLFNRNVNIILGEDACTPSTCVIYWHFLDNKIDEFGGTNHSLRIARTYGIPTFNINDPEQITALVQFIGEI